MPSGNLTVVAELWMLLCTISMPHVEALISRVLATSTINKRHWGLSFAEHKKTMGRIKRGKIYLNHMKVINPWKNKNWILLAILTLYYWLAWLNASVFYASKKRTCRISFSLQETMVFNKTAHSIGESDARRRLTQV